MPELPEAEMVVRGLRERVLGRTFLDVWTDNERMLKGVKGLGELKKELIGRKIQDISRRGKLILIELSGDKTLLAHQKLSGHFLVGKWCFQKGHWIAPPGPLSDKINTFIRLIFSLDDGQQIAFSDLRRFGWVKLLKTSKLNQVKELKELGPEPLDKEFTFEKFKKALGSVRSRVKQALMNQKVIAGIGNIYSDEILWQAKIHPLKKVERLSDEEMKRIYRALKKVLLKAIELKGESISDYRDVEGRKGYFDRERKVYRREGEKCSRCGTIIKRIKLGGRSAYFCPGCQK